MRIWRAFRGTAMCAAAITAALWLAGLVLQLIPTDSRSSSSEELPALSPSSTEQLFFVGAIATTFVVVFTILVAGSVLCRRVQH